MRKAVCLFLMMLVFCSLSTEVFARNEGLVNEAEKSVIESVGEVFSKINGVPISTAERRVFENYFKTTDLSAEDAEKINGHLEKGIEYFEELNAGNISELSRKEKVYFYNYLDKAANVCGLTLTFSFDGKVELRDAETSELVYKQEQVIKATGRSHIYIVLGAIALHCVFRIAASIIRKVSKKND